MLYLHFYDYKLQELRLLERRCHHLEIAWYYGGEMHRYRKEGYVPYGWQGKEENISIK